MLIFDPKWVLFDGLETVLIICSTTLKMLTSMPSLFSAYSSKLRIAVLMVRGGGKTVKPMFMALLRFESRTMISWRLPSTAAFYERYIAYCCILDHVSGAVEALLTQNMCKNTLDLSSFITKWRYIPQLPTIELL